MTEQRPVVAYLVLSHRRPERVEALAARILDLSPAGHVVVHHDPSDSSLPWNSSPPERVHLIPSQPVSWGDWSVVEASLRLLRFARDSLEADWMVMLSGDDRPVVDLAPWEQEISSAQIDGIVPARPITKRPVMGRHETADDLNYVRYAYRWRALPTVHNVGVHRAIEMCRRVSRFSQPLFKLEYASRRGTWFLGLPRRRRFPRDWTIYSGPQWMALGSRAAEAVLHADPEIVAWFTETWIPDQAFFHTILYNHDELRLRNDRPTYVVPQRMGKTRTDWMVIRREDVSDIHSSTAAFGRKFDPSVDPAALELIDATIDRSRAATAARATAARATAARAADAAGAAHSTGT